MMFTCVFLFHMPNLFYLFYVYELYEHCKYMPQHTELQKASERNQIVDAFYILFHFISSKLLGRTKLNLLVKWIDMSFPLCTNSNSIFQPIFFALIPRHQHRANDFRMEVHINQNAFILVWCHTFAVQLTLSRYI